MDEDLEPNPPVSEEAGEQVEPMDATPSPEQQTTPPPEEAGEAVSIVTEDGATKEDNDDDVVLVGEEASATNLSQDSGSTDCLEPLADVAPLDMSTAPPLSTSPSPPTPSCVSIVETPPKPATATVEPIVIDDEEDPEHRDASPSSPAPPEGSSSAPLSPNVLSSTEPDSEIRIASVTTLGSDVQKEDASVPNTPPHPEDDVHEDMNLMITSVTSLQGEATSFTVAEENGLQISSTFSLNPDTPSGRPPGSFNPGRGSGPLGQLVQNGDTGTHNRADSWISQSASVPRNQKQLGVDSPSPASSLPKPLGQSSSSTSSSGSQPRTVKVTCANCKKPLKKGQTAYQRKGSTHLFCSTTCLSAFSHKPTPKKSCTMCKKDITNMKGTIVAQVDSSEAFQEFCSTGCLGAYENKQNPPKSGLKTKCTVCGKLTEIRHEVSFKTVTHKICSDTCFNVYRRANGLIMNCCEQCGDYLPSRASANHFLLVDGQQKRFCCHTCIREFKQAHSKLATCSTCKTLIKTGEVLHSIGASGTMGSYCSVNCMNKGKLTSSSFINAEPSCHFCKRNSLPQYQATLPEGNILNFCSSQCVTKFQNATLQTATNGQTPVSTTNNTVQLKCNYCRTTFSLKPETLDWEDKVYQFCSKTCCEDYKKLHCIVTFCEYCQEEKTLHETVKFSGVKKPFCSEGCKLLYKQEFINRLGLKCVSCNHCSQLCKRAVTRQLGGMTRDFCGDTCAQKFHDWYYKAARCDCCKVQGHLTESVMWRMEVKQFCDQECLLKFYLQQNEPIMVTQKGPENSSLGLDVQGTKLGLVNQGTMAYTGGRGLMRDVKNKAVLCKPLTLTKATYCKPHMQSKHLQTDVDDGVKREYIPVPIPVPVFIPVPMNMYSQVTPSPLALPVPLPVPVFLPTTLQGAEQIVQTINELRNQAVTSEPVEADRISVVEKITEDQKPDLKLVKVKREREEKEEEEEEKKKEGEESSTGSSSEKEEEVEEEEDDKYEPDLDLEADFPQGQLMMFSASDPDPDLEEMDQDLDFSDPPVLATEKTEEEEKDEEKMVMVEEEKTEKTEEKVEEEKTEKMEEKVEEEKTEKMEEKVEEEKTEKMEENVEEEKMKEEQEEEKEETMPRPQPRRQGYKRQAVEESTDAATSSSSSSHPARRHSGGRPLPLKARYGINAWKRWALSSSEQTDDTKVKCESKQNVKKARSKANLLSLSSDELNLALSRFVREVCRPSKERYSADSILYLCLGIQQHLHAKGRTDDLFSDVCYQQFGEELNKVLKDWQPSVLPDGSVWARVEEQSLWSSGQLGDQSPASLLRSLVYLNTKVFGLRTVEQHLSLSFTDVYGPDTEDNRVCIHVPSITQDPHVETKSKKRKRESHEGNQDHHDSAARCPLDKRECHLYHLYRSKCPSSLRHSPDVFYAQPDAAPAADAPLWFTSQPLERRILESVLTRVLVVRNIYTDKPRPQEEEVEEEQQGGEA